MALLVQIKIRHQFFLIVIKSARLHKTSFYKILLKITGFTKYFNEFCYKIASFGHKIGWTRSIFAVHVVSASDGTFKCTEIGKTYFCRKSTLENGRKSTLENDRQWPWKMSETFTLIWKTAEFKGKSPNFSVMIGKLPKIWRTYICIKQHNQLALYEAKSAMDFFEYALMGKPCPV